MRPHITPFLWFDSDAEAAAELYVSIFPNSRITGATRYQEGAPQPAGSVMTVSFELNGEPFIALNGGPAHAGFTETVSFVVACDDQAEIDELWSRLTDGGQEGPCGWCKDRFGLSWQVVPAQMGQLIGGGDPEAARRAGAAMMGMRKLDIAALERARAGGPVSV